MNLLLLALVAVSWTPNTESDLAGYRIKYNNGSIFKGMIVGPSVSKTMFQLPSGKWQFKMAAFDESNNYSEYSEPKFITIDDTDTLVTFVRPHDVVLSGNSISGDTCLVDTVLNFSWKQLSVLTNGDSLHADSISGYNIYIARKDQSIWTKINPELLNKGSEFEYPLELGYWKIGVLNVWRNKESELSHFKKLKILKISEPVKKTYPTKSFTVKIRIE